jgi:hypothetical protein
MKKYISLIKEEVIKLIPCVVFFFVAFSLVDITKIVQDRAYYGFVFILIASLLMGKVMLISDLLPMTKRYDHKPLIYNTLWKTSIYLVCCFFVLIIDRLLPIIIHGKDDIVVADAVFDTFTHLIFWVKLAWIGVLLLIFVAYRELIFAIGTKKAKKLFFG